MIRKRQIFGIVLIIVSILALIFWEQKGREQFLHKEIIALKEDVPKHTNIEAHMFEVKKISYMPEGALTVEDMDKIIGLFSNQYINKEAPLFSEDFVEEKFALDQQVNKHVMAIPNSWLASYPQTLRRGDVAYFYESGKLITSAVVVYARDGANQEVVSEDERRLLATASVSFVEVIVSSEQALLLSQLAGEGKEFVLLYN